MTYEATSAHQRGGQVQQRLTTTTTCPSLCYTTLVSVSRNGLLASMSRFASYDHLFNSTRQVSPKFSRSSTRFWIGVSNRAILRTVWSRHTHLRRAPWTDWVSTSQNWKKSTQQ